MAIIGYYDNHPHWGTTRERGLGANMTRPRVHRLINHDPQALPPPAVSRARRPKTDATRTIKAIIQ